jgi:hypothetical protein
MAAGVRGQTVKSVTELVMKTILMLALLGLFAAVQMGCEGKAEVDDDGAAVKVDPK